VTLVADVQTFAPGTLLEFYVIDPTALGGTPVYISSGLNVLQTDITWQGQIYTRFPVEGSGFDLSGRGQLPTPKLVAANVSGLFGGLLRTYDDLIGAKVTRRRTLYKYLDAVNYPGGVNPSADPTQAWPDDVFFVNRKSNENNLQVELELVSAFDWPGLALPRRQVVANVCTWRYRSAECSYAGGAKADLNDVATTDLSRDQCGKRLASCKLRFGATAPLPYGGFPATSLIK
jgi:lambda family phage minor tail protein L